MRVQCWTVSQQNRQDLKYRLIQADLLYELEKPCRGVMHRNSFEFELCVHLQ